MLGWLLALGLVFADTAQQETIVLVYRLVQDGNYDRARAVLDGVDSERVNEEEEAAKYYAALGLVFLHEKNYAEAIEALHLAIAEIAKGKSGPPAKRLWMFIGQAHIQSMQHEQAIQALQNADEQQLLTHLLRAEGLIYLTRYSKLWTALDDAVKRFPESPELIAYRIRLLLSLGLWHQAQQQAAIYVTMDIESSDVIRLAFFFRQAGDGEGTLLLLRHGRMRFDDTLLWKNAAAVALENQQYFEAGECLQVLSEQDPNLALQAAEAYRKAGSLSRALLLNQMASDSQEKLRQRLGVLVEKKQFERAIALAPRVQRTGLDEDDSVRYALSYARFQVGLYESAGKLLNGISDPMIFKQSIELRKAINRCLDEGC